MKISIEGDVELVVPLGFDHAKLPEIVAKRQAWIAKTKAKLKRDRTQTPDDWQIEKPETILFRWRSNDIDADIETLSTSKSGSNKSKSKARGLQSKKRTRSKQSAQAKKGAQGFAQRSADKKGQLETWSVDYQPQPSHKTLCIPDEAQQHLLLQGNIEHLPNCQAVLRKWLAHRAQRDLAPWLRQLGFNLNLPCRHISVRGQKTCWASCSNHKDISLNFKLLFLPRPLVHYVLVHELCHTVHMNHSKQFWALVGEKQHDYHWRKEAIKTAWRYVPRWVEGK
ncbi:MAG: YgjP-like metallopeptidase domain-containing protein [Cyanobacteria bacterium J06621_11]